MLHAALEMQVWTWESLRTLMGLSEQVHSRVKDWIHVKDGHPVAQTGKWRAGGRCS